MLFILFNAGAEVAVSLRSCLGLAVTGGNGFKMDSFSLCLTSVGLSEDRAGGGEISSPSSSDSAHSCDPSALAIPTEQPCGLLLAAETSDIACCVMALVLFKG